ncbi:MAG: 50S ribosomal protein L33 [Planctomycetes bacterium]|nr:50S ribosomal protein L33 [Planctomycetota bacterium]
MFLECSKCGTRYYRTSKAAQAQAKLEFRKFCSSCRGHTLHKEKKK